MNNKSINFWLQIISAVILLVSFFMPWVNWDGSAVSGMSMATGDFFRIAESRFELSNPFPKLSFLFFGFWLLPILCVVIIGLVFMKKKLVPFSFIAGAMSLGLVTIYILFTGILVDLGAGESVRGMLKPGIYLHGLAALTLILSAFPVKNQVWKFAWLLLGPVIAFGSFKLAEKYVMGETHEKTDTVKADYSLTSEKLLNEFLENADSANKKYIEKMLEVSGNISAVEIQDDSTSTIKFADSTGSYAIFSFDKEQLDEIKKIQNGESVALKGVCSGGIFSEILGTISISFKRSTIQKK